MLKEVYPHIYLNEIPLPNFALKKVNSYIITGEDKNLIIDTAFNTAEGREALWDGIKKLSLDLHKTDLVLTHMHPDHTGMAAALDEHGVKVLIGQADGALIKQVYAMEQKSPLEKLYEEFSQEQDVLPTRAYSFGDNRIDRVNFALLNEGEILQVGNYRLEIINTPGHTPGHIGLYERKHKLFFCGDHILAGISPSVVFWGFELDILGQYTESLHKIDSLDIDYLFTAHKQILRDHHTRIGELLVDNDQRLDEVKQIILRGPQTPGGTASQIHWNVTARWEDFPKSQKFFAIGETLAFLEHLVHTGLVVRLRDKSNLFYQIKK